MGSKPSSTSYHVGPRASHFTPLGFHFLICPMRTVTVHPYKVAMRLRTCVQHRLAQSQPLILVTAVTTCWAEKLFPLNFSFVFLKLVTPCGPGQRPRRPAHLTPQPLPKLAHGSMADLAFGLETYNDILSCLYTSKVIHVDSQDSKVSAQERAVHNFIALLFT